jgi:lipid-A-disaccharide synthase
VPELLQKEMTAENIYTAAAEWLDYRALLKDVENKLYSVREKLGGGGAVEKTAELLIEQGGLKRDG